MGQPVGFPALKKPVKIDYEAFIDNVLRKGTPRRVHFIELLMDVEIQQAIDRRFGGTAGLDKKNPHYPQKCAVAMQRFLGYDYVRTGVEGVDLEFRREITADTAALPHETGRGWMAERNGPISSWADFEKY